MSIFLRPFTTRFIHNVRYIPLLSTRYISTQVLNNNHPTNTSTDYDMLCSLISRNQPVGVRQLNELLRKSIDTRNYIDIQKVWGLYEKAKKKPNLYAYWMYIQYLVSTKNMETAERVVKEMKTNDIIPNEKMYGTLMNGWIEVNEIDKAFEVFHAMVENGHKPDAVVFAILAKGVYARGNESYISKLQELEKKWNIKTNENLFDSTIETLCINNKRREALMEIQEMWAKGLSPPGNVYLSLALAHVKAWKFKIAVNIIDQMYKRGLKPELVRYSMVIEYLLKFKQYAIAFDLFEKLKNDFQVAPDAQLYQMFINSCLKSNNITKANELLRELRTKYKLQPTVSTYTCFLNYFASKGDVPRMEKVFNVLRNMKITIVEYTTVLKRYFTDGMVDKAEQVIKEIEERKIQLDYRCYNYLISAYCTIGHLDKALYWLQKMHSDHLAGNPEIHKPSPKLIEFVVSRLKEQGLDEQVKIVTSMRPDIYTE